MMSESAHGLTGPTAIPMRIEEEIQNHHEEDLEAVVSLSHRRNTVSPVNMLPPEILCSIFRFVTFVDRDDYDDRILSTYHSFPGVPAWIQRITHVCRLWRTIALNAPELWTELPLRSERWTEIMLERSRMAKITIHVSCDGRPAPMIAMETTRLAMMHQKRIRELSLTGIGPSEYAKLKSDWPTSIPNLQRLTICIFGFKAFKSPPLSSFADSTQLQSIALFNVEIDWKMSTFANLTDLQVKVGSALRLDEHSSSTIEDLHCVLLNMPQLAHLNLSGILPRLENSLNHTTIPLVKLRTLVLQGRGENVAAILQMISFPPLDRLELYFSGNIDQHLDKMLAHMAPQLSLDPTRSPNYITHLRLHAAQHPILALAIEGYHSHNEALPSHSEPTRQTSKPFFSLRFEPRGQTDDADDQDAEVDRGLKVILPNLPLHHVTAIYASQIYICEDSWTHPIGNLQQVANVTFDWDSCPGSFMDALKKHTPTDMITSLSNDTRPPPFAKLRNVHFSSMVFSGELNINSIIEALHCRSNIGLPIHKFTVTDCVDVSPDDIDLIKQIVPEVEWDGRGNSTTYSDSEEDA